MVWLIRAELFVAGDFTGHSDRIYTTFILSTALQNFGTRANSFGHGPLDLHDKICSSFFNVYYWNGTPETRTALKFVSPCTYMTAVHMWFQSRFRHVRGAFMGCSKKKNYGKFFSAISICMARCLEKAKKPVTNERRNKVIPCNALYIHCKIH